jgi:hypothetical protein
MPNRRQTGESGEKSVDPSRPAEEKKKSRRRAQTPEEYIRTILPESDEAKLLSERREVWYQEYAPASLETRLLIDSLIVNLIREERCREREMELHKEIVERAEFHWDEDRSADVLRMVKRYAKKPGLLVASLKRTTQGCDWLLNRWHRLERALEANRELTQQERSLAFDLAGVDPILRCRDPWLSKGFASAIEWVQSEIDKLEKYQIDAANPMDERERLYEMSGLGLYAPKEMDLVRKFESYFSREVFKFLRMLGPPSTSSRRSTTNT